MENLRQRALLEAMQRTRSGVFVYPALWIAIGWLSELADTQRSFWLINTAIFVLTALARVVFHRLMPRLIEQRYELTRQWFVALSLANPLHWGLLTAISIASPAEFGSIRLTMLLGGCGIAAAGVMVFAIDNALRLAFVTLTLVPTVFALFTFATPENLQIGVLAVMFAIYVIIASGHVGADYWRSLHAEAQLDEKAKELEELSYTDGLTTLRNRRFFEANYEIEWRRAQRAKTPLTLLMIDIDHFKRVNDQHGHDIGDVCLREVGKTIAGQMSRSGDIAARYGGEEFIVLMVNTDLAGARAVAERIMSALRQLSIPLEKGNLRLTCSIGGNSCVPGEEDPAHLIKEADILLYQAKQSGRNRAVIGAGAGNQAYVADFIGA